MKKMERRLLHVKPPQGDTPIPLGEGFFVYRPVTLVVKGRKRKNELDYHLILLTNERIPVPMISRTGQDPGGHNVPRSGPGN